jgi:uncharacterized cofD-like protein
MLKSFLRHYFEIPEAKTKIVCLGGGVGTATILKGLRNGNFDLTAIVSMADDGGSAGRLRRAFAIPPPGDLVNCLAALSDEESIIRELFLFRFKGERYGKDTDLGGQKLGNLIFVALTDIFGGDTHKALEEFSKIISSKGRVLPATINDVNIWAVTEDNKKVIGEQNIDLGLYNSKSRTLKEVHLSPPGVKAYAKSTKAIEEADVIIIGPGDLFSTVLPVLIVPQIKKTLVNSRAKKIFIVNIANKPFETAGYKVSDYLKTIEAHVPEIVLDKIFVNNNQKVKIPSNLKYSFVLNDAKKLNNYAWKIIEEDLINTNYPLSHDSDKIALAIQKILNL